MQWDAKLVLAPMLNHIQHHQVRACEEKLLSLVAGGFGGTGQKAQVLAACHISQMLEADSGQAANFLFGEDLLAGTNRHAHFVHPKTSRNSAAF
jgi:hypothetical protein